MQCRQFQTEFSQLPPDIATHRVIDQIAALLAAPPSSTFNADAQHAALAGIARILGAETSRAAADLSNPEVRDRLASLLTRVPPIASGPPKRLRFLSYETHIHATRAADLCSKESLDINFARVGDTRGADARVAAARVYARTAFYFLKPPASAVAIPLLAKRLAKTVAACAALDPASQTTSATSDEGAVRGLWLLAALQKLAASGTLPSGSTCDNQAPSADCIRDIASPQHGFYMFGCAPTDTRCTLVLSSTRFVEVKAGAGLTPLIEKVSARLVMPVTAFPDPDND